MGPWIVVGLCEACVDRGLASKRRRRAVASSSSLTSRLSDDDDDKITHPCFPSIASTRNREAARGGYSKARARMARRRNNTPMKVRPVDRSRTGRESGCIPHPTIHMRRPTHQQTTAAPAPGGHHVWVRAPRGLLWLHPLRPLCGHERRRGAQVRTRLKSINQSTKACRMMMMPPPI